MSTLTVASVGKTGILNIKKSNAEQLKYRPDLGDVDLDISSELNTNTTGQFSTITGGLLDTCDVKLEPIQDLHGYSKPWVGGSGKNKLNPTGESGTTQGIIVVKSDDGKFTASGTNGSGSACAILCGEFEVENGVSYTLTGCPSNGSSSSYRLDIRINGTSSLYKNLTDYGNGTTFTADFTGTLYICMRFAGSYAITGSLEFAPMVRLASETSATFEPYANICPISGHDEIVINNGPKNWIPYIEDGDLNVQTGAEEPTANRKRSGFIAIDRTKRYVISGFNVGMYGADIKFCHYNADKTFTGGEVINISQGQDIYFSSFSSGTAYIRFAASSSVITNKMQAEIGTVSTAYEPYREPEQTTISLGQTVYGGMLDAVSGVLTITDTSIDLGSLSWDGKDGSGRFYASISDIVEITSDFTTGILSSSLTIDGRVISDVSNATDLSIARYTQGGVKRVYVKDTTHSDKTSFKTYVTGMQLVYTLATPLIIQLTPQQLETLIGQNNVTVPLDGQSLTSAVYRELFAWDDVTDVVEELDTKKSDISAIGTDESGRTTASKAYAIGEHFYKDGKFCTAIASIASGATFTLNTNYVEGTIADALEVKDVTSEFTFNSNINWDVSAWNKIIKQGNMIDVELRFDTPSTVSNNLELITTPSKYQPKFFDSSTARIGGIIYQTWTGTPQGIISLSANKMYIASNVWGTSKSVVAHFTYFI